MLFTVNSQPRVNGSKSDHPKYGWGPENGYVFQKAYFEFMIHASLIEPLRDYLMQFEDITF